MSATLQYKGYLNKTAHEYFSLPGYDGLVRKEINSGDFHKIQGFLGADLRLLDNSLSFRATGVVSHIKNSGIDAQSMNVVSANVQANYFFKNFSVVLYYNTPQKNLDPFGNGIRYRFNSSYGALVNYAVGDFKASLHFCNWFNGYRYYMDFDSQRYAIHGWQMALDLARSVQLTLTYTIPYGKKIKQNNEISGEGSVGSAILK